MPEKLDNQKTHKHKCMRCTEEFDCKNPSTCTGRYEVMPFIVGFGDHCPANPDWDWIRALVKRLAPRQQKVCPCCGGANGKCTGAAASSPVVRPQIRYCPPTCYEGLHPGQLCTKEPAARPLYWTATDWYPLLQKANDAVFALEGKASPDAEDMLRCQFFQARVAIGKAENILRERFKREGIE